MIDCYYLNVKNLDLNNIKLSKNEINEIKKYKLKKDQKLKYGSILLKKHVFKKHDILNPIIKRTKYNKPYISNHENFHFNISKSKYTTICGISDTPIGVDIEYINPKIDLNIAKFNFTKDEYENIINSKNPYDEFYTYWTIKEAYTKYLAKGLNLKFNSFNITDININLTVFNLNNYKIAIANKEKIDGIKIIHQKNLIY